MVLPEAEARTVRKGSLELNAFGLGHDGEVLPEMMELGRRPPKNLPLKVQGQLCRIAYGCAYASHLHGREAFRCPHTKCSFYPHRRGYWRTAERRKGDADQMMAYLKDLMPGGRMACEALRDAPLVRDLLNRGEAPDANSKTLICKLPGGIELQVPKIEKTAPLVSTVQKPVFERVSVVICAYCEREFEPRRKSARYCSARCRDRAYRDRDRGRKTDDLRRSLTL
jgi:hypothetical protein